MKSLQTIQKIAKVFKMLSMIATVLSFLWAATSLFGLVCAILWETRGALGIGWVDMYRVKAETLNTAIAKLLCDAILAAADGVLFLKAWRYFKSELTDGTPFTKTGEITIRRLGISTIVMPNVAVILSAVVYSVCAVKPMPDWSTGASTLMGAVLILLSTVFRYGAELEEIHHAS